MLNRNILSVQYSPWIWLEFFCLLFTVLSRWISLLINKNEILFVVPRILNKANCVNPVARSGIKLLCEHPTFYFLQLRISTRFRFRFSFYKYMYNSKVLVLIKSLLWPATCFSFTPYYPLVCWKLQSNIYRFVWVLFRVRQYECAFLCRQLPVARMWFLLQSDKLRYWVNNLSFYGAFNIFCSTNWVYWFPSQFYCLFC